MGRQRRRVASGRKQETIEERLGLKDQICMSCNSRNGSDADQCRNCGHTQLRPKNRDYEDA